MMVGPGQSPPGGGCSNFGNQNLRPIGGCRPPGPPNHQQFFCGGGGNSFDQQQPVRFQAPPTPEQHQNSGSPFGANNADSPHFKSFQQQLYTNSGGQNGCGPPGSGSMVQQQQQQRKMDAVRFGDRWVYGAGEFFSNMVDIFPVFNWSEN